MIQKIKMYVVTIMMMMVGASPLLVPVATYACSSNIADKVAQGATDAGGSPGVNCDSTGVGGSSLSRAARGVVNLFSIIVGAVAIIMIIYGGFRYITSGGDSGRVGNAKNTLIYAIVGLIIVALAQLIVHFVLNQSDAIANPSGA